MLEFINRIKTEAHSLIEKADSREELEALRIKYLGRKGEIVVDNVWSPRRVYGIADGRGDFIRSLSKKQANCIDQLQKLIEDV